MPPPPIQFVDGHNDLLLRLHLRGGGPDTFLDRAGDGHLDLVRAREGGLVGGLFAVFVVPEDRGERAATAVPAREPPYAQPLAPAVDSAYAASEAGAMIELLHEIEAASSGAVKVARSSADVERAIAGGAFAAVLHFEGAEPIDPDLASLERLYERGLRSLGLVWSRPNAFAEGVAFRFPSSPDTGAGLTDAGRRLVRECNRLGILVDLSHLNERGFWDVAASSQAPLVATHSNAHALSPNSRNLTNAQLDEIGRSRGIVGLTFHAGMIGADGRVDPAKPLEELLRHVDHVVDRIGVDHVGFGSDFDGAGVIAEIGDASGLPRLAAALRERGYGRDDVAGLAHGNWLRVIRETWR